MEEIKVMDESHSTLLVMDGKIDQRELELAQRKEEEQMEEKMPSILCIEAAEHWELLAKSAAEMAAWNRDHGLDLSAPGQSVGDRQAETYSRCARTLRLEAATGKPNCMCHEAPSEDCPNGGMGMKTIGQRGRK